MRQELRDIDSLPVVRLDGKGGFERNFELVRRHLRLRKHRRTLVGAVNDMAALGALRAFEEAGAANLCAVMGQNGIKEARMELRRPGSRFIGTVAYLPERYGEELIPLAMSMLEKKPLPDAVFAKHKLLTPHKNRSPGLTNDALWFRRPDIKTNRHYAGDNYAHGYRRGIAAHELKGDNQDHENPYHARAS